MIKKFIVALIDTKKNNPNFYIVLSILAALKRSERVGRVDLLQYDDLNSRLTASNYDLLIALDGEQLNGPIFARAVRCVRTSALWVWEDPYERRVNVANAALFDVVFTNDLGSVRAYGDKGCFLPLAGAEEMPVVQDDAHLAHDLFFAGSAWPNRVTFLRRLTREMPELSTKIVLQYNPGVPRAFLDRPESEYAGSISHQEFLALANRSRVTLTLHRRFSGDGQKRAATSPGPRLFEVALAGGAQLVDANGVATERFFKPESEVKLFSGFDDFKQSLKEVLADPEKRFELASRAQERARREHGFDQRVETLLARAEEIPERRAPEPIGLGGRRPRLLFVTHNSVAYGNFGGVEVYQNTVASELRRDYEVFFFLPAHPPIHEDMRKYVLTDQRYAIIKSFLVPEFDMWVTLSHRELEDAFGRVLSDYGIDLIHFHHIINHCASLPIVAKMVGVPSVFTFQDFWAVCRNFNLVDHTGVYCAIAQRDWTACDVCLHATYGVQPGAQSYRREFFHEVLRSITCIIYNTPHTVEVARAMYPGVVSKEPQILGLPTPRGAPKRSPEGAVPGREDDAGPLRVVFLGNFTVAKGASVFLNAAAVMQDDNIVFTVCGGIYEPYRTRFEKNEFPNVIVEGGFAPGELDLTRFHVALHLSIWPETYCITLSEAWQAGLVPIVSDCGALGDRVTHDVNGFKIEVGDSGRLVSLLRRLTDRRELDRLRGNVGPHLWLTPAEHVARLRTIYDHAAAGRSGDAEALAEAPAGSGPTLALTRLAPLPRLWTAQTAGPVIPQYGRDLKPLSPLWRDSYGIRAALAAGRTSPARLAWAIDGIGGDPIQLDDWAGTPARAGTAPIGPNFIGWKGSVGGWAASTRLGLRATNGDLVLLQSEDRPRPDVLRATGRPAQGFETDRVIVDMLEEGIYGLEFYRQVETDAVQVAPLPVAIVVADEIVLLQTSTVLGSVEGWHFPVVPLPALDWEMSPESAREDVRFSIDEIGARNYAPARSRPHQALILRGWLVAIDMSPAYPVVLRLSGRGGEVFVPLAAAARPDVVEHLGGDADVWCGFSGTVWLTGLPDDEYEIALLYRSGASARAFAVGTLSVAGARVSAAQHAQVQPARRGRRSAKSPLHQIAAAAARIKS